MLEVCRKESPIQKTPKFENREYIVTKYEERETIENNRKIIERVPKKQISQSKSMKRRK